MACSPLRTSSIRLITVGCSMSRSRPRNSTAAHSPASGLSPWMASPVPVLTGLTKLKPFIEDPATAVASPQGLGSTDHDLELQLRKRGISKVVLCGMLAYL